MGGLCLAPLLIRTAMFWLPVLHKIISGEKSFASIQNTPTEDLQLIGRVQSWNGQLTS